MALHLRRSFYIRQHCYNHFIHSKKTYSSCASMSSKVCLWERNRQNEINYFSVTHYRHHYPVLINRRTMATKGFGYYLTTDFAPVACCVKSLEFVHDVTGLPWWATIAITTFCLRSCLTLPLTIASMKSGARLANLQPEIMAKAAILKEDANTGKEVYGWDEKMAKHQFAVNMKRIKTELYVRDNCHPLKTVLSPWVQIPLWITMSLSIRNLSGFLPFLGAVPVLRPDLSTGGTLWFPNLLSVDGTFILPVTFGMLTLAITEMGTLRTTNPGKVERYLTNFFRGFSIFIIPVACCVPSSLCWYWTCSASFGLAQNIVLQFPKVKRLVGIQRTTAESDTPFRDMLTVAKSKYSFKRKSDDNAGSK